MLCAVPAAPAYACIRTHLILQRGVVGLNAQSAQQLLLLLLNKICHGDLLLLLCAC